MTDIIKEFNMTDVLGMLVPGSVVAFLLDKEFAIIDNLESLTNVEFSTGIMITLLIVVGYFFGMLLHEIGDVIEKLLWYYPGFNPRLYAAYATNMYICGEEDMSPKELKWLICLSFILSSLLAALIIWMCLRIFDKMLTFWIIICITLALGVFTYLAMRLKKKNGNFLSIMQEAFQLCNFNKPLSYSVWKTNDKNDEYVRMILRKRDLFDGFRTSARNLLVMFVFMGTYASATQGIISTIRSVILNKPAVLGIVIISLVVMLWRYYHFTYLRYKYCYEDYVQQKQSSPSAC